MGQQLTAIIIKQAETLGQTSRPKHKETWAKQNTTLTPT